MIYAFAGAGVEWQRHDHFPEGENMKKNIGSTDKTARYIVGAAVIGAGLYFQSWWGVIGLLPIVTAAIGWCPPYAMFGINTCATEPGGDSGGDAGGESGGETA